MHDIDILPKNMRKRKRVIKFDNPTYGLALLAVVILSTFLVNRTMDARLQALGSDIERLQGEAVTLAGRFPTGTHPQMAYTALRERVGALSQELDRGLPWALLLDEISAATPAETTIRSIKETSEQMITIEGTTTTFASVVKMKEQMDARNVFLDVQVLSFEFTPSHLEGSPLSVVTFTVTAKVNRNEGG